MANLPTHLLWHSNCHLQSHMGTTCINRDCWFSCRERLPTQGKVENLSRFCLIFLFHEMKSINRQEERNMRQDISGIWLESKEIKCLPVFSLGWSIWWTKAWVRDFFSLSHFISHSIVRNSYRILEITCLFIFILSFFLLLLCVEYSLKNFFGEKFAASTSQTPIFIPPLLFLYFKL